MISYGKDLLISAPNKGICRNESIQENRILCWLTKDSSARFLGLPAIAPSSHRILPQRPPMRQVAPKARWRSLWVLLALLGNAVLTYSTYSRRTPKFFDSSRFRLPPTSMVDDPALGTIPLV